MATKKAVQRARQASRGAASRELARLIATQASGGLEREDSRRHEERRTRRRTRLATPPAVPLEAVPELVREAAIELRLLAECALKPDLEPTTMGLVLAAFGAAFGPLPDRWARSVALAVCWVIQLPIAERGRYLRMSGAELIEHRKRWLGQHTFPPPSYVTASVVQWVARHVTPAHKAGGGRLTFEGMARLLLDPPGLAREIKRTGGNLAAVRAIQAWRPEHDASGWRPSSAKQR